MSDLAIRVPISAIAGWLAPKELFLALKFWRGGSAR